MPRSLAVLAATFIAGALASCAGLESPPDNPQAVVNQRVAVMKGFAATLGMATNFAQGKATSGATGAKVAAARKGADQLGNLFPRGTALGDKGVVNSRALSTIFANRADFDAKRSALEKALADLDRVVTKGSKAETTAALPPLKNACASCHARYRTPDES